MIFEIKLDKHNILLTKYALNDKMKLCILNNFFEPRYRKCLVYYSQEEETRLEQER